MPSAWAKAAAQPLVRGNSVCYPGELEPGVRFFVRMLEKLECKTEWSCEGHPTGFYIVFHGPERVVREIAGAGIFSVAVSTHGGWYLSIEQEDLAHRFRYPWTEKKRRKSLRLGADLWALHFGELDDDNYPWSLVVEPRDRTVHMLREMVISVDCFLRKKNPNEDDRRALILALMDSQAALAADPQTLTTIPGA